MNKKMFKKYYRALSNFCRRKYNSYHPGHYYASIDTPFIKMDSVVRRYGGIYTDRYRDFENN